MEVERNIIYELILKFSFDGAFELSRQHNLQSVMPDRATQKRRLAELHTLCLKNRFELVERMELRAQ